MTALAANRNTKKFSDDILPSYLPSGGVAAAKKIYAGAMVMVNQSGYYEPASADSTLKMAGVSEELVDNSSGSAGDVSAYKVRRGAYLFGNSGTTDAVSAADIGRACYVVDDQTVARTSAAGARPVAGRVLGLDGTSVIVELGADDANDLDLLMLAGETLTSDQFKLVKVHTDGTVIKSGAGEKILGVLQNAPASGAVAIVRTRGVSRTKADGTGVTRGDYISSAAAGVARATVAAASGLAVTDTSDGGAATDPLKGAYVIGIALETAAASVVFGMQITHSGAVPSTAV
jgi:hypothetical protein